MKPLPTDLYYFSHFELDFLQLFDFEKTLRMKKELGPDDERVQYLIESRKKFDEKPIHTFCSASRPYACPEVAKYMVIPVRYCHLDMAAVRFACASGNHVSYVQGRFRVPSIVRPFSLQGLKDLLAKITQRNLAEDFIYHLSRAWGLIGENAKIYPGPVEEFLWGSRFHTLSLEDFEERIEEAVKGDAAQTDKTDPVDGSSADDTDETDGGEIDPADQTEEFHPSKLTVTASGYLDTSDADDQPQYRQSIREKIDYTNWKCRSLI